MKQIEMFFKKDNENIINLPVKMSKITFTIFKKDHAPLKDYELKIPPREIFLSKYYYTYIMPFTYGHEIKEHIGYFDYTPTSLTFDKLIFKVVYDVHVFFYYI
jgi:hypothetical protein